ncbi:MAG TPA: VOC family protein [Nodosilinea sp.]|nr:VOC family protein [Nodosilinea sp.]
MTIELDHTIIPCRDQVESAQRLAELLGVPWAAQALGPFSPVYVNSGLTLDFQSTDEDFPIYHVCFRVTEAEFDAILERLEASGIDYRSSLRGRIDRQISTQFGGRMIYWNEPDGHQWELLTVSYARPNVCP